MRSTGFLFALSIILTACAATPAEAQADDQTICITTLRLWNGSPEDVRQIQTVPVPESYRSGSQACGGPLRSVDLISWHERFGTEASTAAAFDYLDHRDRTLAHSVDQEITSFERAVKDSRRSSGTSKEDKRASRIDRVRGQAYSAVRSMEDWLGQGLLLISGAETFESRAFRDRAARFLASYEPAGARFAALAKRSVAEIQDPGIREAIQNVLQESRLKPMADDLRIRIALFDAQQSLSAEDLKRLDSLVAEARTPALSRIGEDAFGGGDDFCDLPDYADESVKAACEDDSDFEFAAVNFLFLDAMANLLNDNDTAAETFFRVYERDRKDHAPWNTRWTGVDRRVVRLAIAWAEMRERVAARQNSPWQRSNDRQYALDQFIKAARLFSPVDDPVSFRTIATRALAVHEAIGREREPGEAVDDRSAPAMAYFRLVLAHLDALVSGRE